MTGRERCTPLQLPELTAALLERGYAESDVRGILGGNFLGGASQVWPGATG